MSTALIIVDMQRGMQNTDMLLGTWRKACQPVIHVRHISREPTSPFWPGKEGVKKYWA